jgi:7,8-dihydropterin-6-yl-methyl-4-(beta-D-ribofuranosyl)aminobenzene 5'-phosphate synthase
MRLATVFDNRALYPHLKPGWGFSCLVGDDLLFDTGGDGRTLLANIAQMGLDPGGIRTVVLSHAHADHTGGLSGLLTAGLRPAVYVPRSFPQRFKADVCALTSLVEVYGSVEVKPGIHTTGEMGRGIVEQGLAIETGEGLVVVTGCAHPGTVAMVRRARKVAGDDVALVMGGFHLGGAGRDWIQRVIADLRRLGVRRVGPCHCTGDQAIRMLEEAFGAGFVPVGVGQVVSVGSG